MGPLSLWVILSGCGGPSAPAEAPPPEVPPPAGVAAPTEGQAAEDRLRHAVRQLGPKLKAALQERMAADGAPGAIDFCHQEAGPLTAKVATLNSVSLGRTSARLRSPANAPQPWQQQVIERFERRVAQGVAVTELDFVEHAPHRVRVAVGIPVEAPCLVCHGSDLAPPIADAIAARYPGDAATGYALGELRGIVWAEAELGVRP